MDRFKENIDNQIEFNQGKNIFLDLNAKTQLRKIYSDLFENIQTSTNPIESISKSHYEKLKSWLKENNPFAEKIYKKEKEMVSSLFNLIIQSEYLGG